MFPIDNLGQTGNINSIHSPSFNSGYGGLGNIGLLGLLGIGTTILNHELASSENEEARTWQEEMYEKQMSFNASQAEIARDWQERFYNQYNSPKALMRQYKDAGFNPILATGVSPSNPPSASSASASQPSAVSHLGQSTLSQMVGEVYNMLSLKSDLQLKQAQTNKLNAETEGQGISNSRLAEQLDSEIAKNNATKEQLLQAVKESIERTENEKIKQVLNGLEIEIKKLDKESIKYSNIISGWRAHQIEKFGVDPATYGWETQALQLFANALNSLLPDFNFSGFLK